MVLGVEADDILFMIILSSLIYLSVKISLTVLTSPKPAPSAGQPYPHYWQAQPQVHNIAA